MKKKLSDSRLLRLVLIGILSLLSLQLVTNLVTFWLLILIEKEANIDKINSYNSIIKIIYINVSGAIATIITAAIARYGVREATQNLTLPVGESGKDKKEK